MNTQSNEAPADNTAQGRKPDFIAYNVTEGKGGKGYFHKVGAAWQHKDGQGYDLQLDSMPVGGRVTLREQREERLQELDGQRQAQHSEQVPTQAINQGHEQER
ncbi:Uncharacterised protein [Halioglobus japonicus]|nr:Uncharacterised protein [Halioglobus japonicus]